MTTPPCPGDRSPERRAPRGFLCAFLLLVANAPAAQWLALGGLPRQDDQRALFYSKSTAVRPSDGKQVTAHLAHFTSRTFRLVVVDLGAEPSTLSLAGALRANGCVAGVNGGFFHSDWRPSGLVIADGRRINRLETARLLSGVIYSDDRGIHLVRRSRLQDHPGISALLQSGPFLVEGGRAVGGLSASDPSRRSFVATDWRGHWVLGSTLGPLGLAELADCLASPEALLPWRVDRALNLDGGSSTGFFFEGRGDQAPVVLEPRKWVRNLLGVAPR